MPPKKKASSSTGKASSSKPVDSWAREQAVSTLNDAKLASDGAKKCEHLKQLMELVVHKDSALLDEFLEPLLEMRVDTNTQVRKTIATLCEQIGKASSDRLAKCVEAITNLLADESAAVQKAAIKSATTLWTECFHYVLKVQKTETRIPKLTKDTWKASNNMKNDLKALALSETANDGVKMQAVRFLEKTLVILGSFSDSSDTQTVGTAAKKNALLDPDSIATEADSVLGVLLECLKPEAIQKQASTASLGTYTSHKILLAFSCSFVTSVSSFSAHHVRDFSSSRYQERTQYVPIHPETVCPYKRLTSISKILVMIQSAVSVSEKCAQYVEFVAPALCDIADQLTNHSDDNSDAQDTPAVASVKKELRGAFVTLLKLDTSEMEMFQDRIDETLRERLDGVAEADAAKQRRERVEQRKREREGRGGSKRRKMDMDDDFVDNERDTDTPPINAQGHHQNTNQVTPPHLLQQVLQTMDALAHSDRAVLDGFVAQLAPEVLADVVLASLSNVHLVVGRTLIDVHAGMDAGAEGFVEWAADTHERTKSSVGGSVGVSSQGLIAQSDTHIKLDESGALVDEATEAGTTKGKKGASKPPPPFVPKVGEMSEKTRRAQSAAALARIIKASDPSGAVAAMGGSTVQRALLARLATGVAAASHSVLETSADASENHVGPVGGASISMITSDAATNETHSLLSSSVFTDDTSNSKTVAGALLETLIQALPDQVAHQSVVRILGATFVNETIENENKIKGEKISDVGLYARSLMTVLVGVLEQTSSARSKHLSRVLLDAPAIPEAATRLLRALVRLPLNGDGDENKSSFGFTIDSKKAMKGQVSWGGIVLPSSSDTVTVALHALLELIEHKQVVRGKCLEIALEAATSTDEDVRSRAIRMVVTKVHPMGNVTQAVEQFASFHLGEAASAGAKALADARAVAVKASSSIAAKKQKLEATEKARLDKAKRLKAEAEGRKVTEEDETATAPETAGVNSDEQEMLARIEHAAVQSAVNAVSRKISLFCALCKNSQNLLPKVFEAFVKLPEELRPALLDGTNSFDALVRLVGAECEPLLVTIGNPPPGSEQLAVRAIRVLADTKRETDEYMRDAAAAGGVVADDVSDSKIVNASLTGLVIAAEQLSTNKNNSLGIEVLVPLLGSVTSERARQLMPSLVALPDELFSDALDRLCGCRTLDEFGIEGEESPTTVDIPSPLSASEILVALHDVDPGKHTDVPLKKIIQAVSACFERPKVFTPEVLASALSKMVEQNPLPLLFMRSVIQAETAYPNLKEFTLGLLRQLVRRKVWKGDGKIWEGFIRCAKRAAPRSFPVLCELPEVALSEVLKKFPALVEPLRAYVNAPAVAGTVPRAVRDALAKAC
tara:strand:+ start:12555 stop:16649 length:4095 start_codon:yes stop_codon:yes gene_type:complete